MTPLHGAIGRYPHTEALFADPTLRLEPFPVISRAFAPMIREQRFGVSEMAIATFIMARAAGSDLVLLPVVMAARSQNGAMLRRADDAFGPADLRGQRVGARAYSQTTGLWLRGDLREAYGVAPHEIRWVTFEDAHEPSFRDPAWCERAAAGDDILAMLKDGSLDAAIFGNDVPVDAWLAPVFPDPDAAGLAFEQRHGFVPVNHMVVLRADVARRPGVAGVLLQLFRQAGNPFPSGRAALEPVVSLAIDYAVDQGLIDRRLTQDEVWAGLPADVEGAAP